MKVSKFRVLIGIVSLNLAFTPAVSATDALTRNSALLQLGNPVRDQASLRTPPASIDPPQVSRPSSAHVAISIGDGRATKGDEVEAPANATVKLLAQQQPRPRAEPSTPGAPPRASQRRRPSASISPTRARPEAEALPRATPQAVAPASGTEARRQGAAIQQVRPPGALATAPDFDRSAFETMLHGSLRDTVKGYAFVLMRSGQVVAEGADGFARSGQDGRLAMTPATPVNIGSLFKFVAGVSMLHAMEQPPAGSGFSDADLNEKLNAPLSLLIPAFWRQEMAAPTTVQLTFRDYLQHKTGFRGRSMLQEFRDPGSQPPRARGRLYQNLNFSMIGFALGAFINPGWVSEMNQDPNRSASNPHDIIYSQRALGDFMDTYIRSTIMSKVPGGAAPSCDAANEFRTTGAYAYRDRLDHNPGIITSRKADGKECSGAGGYWMSARHLTAFASAALHGDRLLSAEAKRLMYGANEEPKERLVWSSADASNWTRENFGEPYVVWSDGRQPYDEGQVSGGVMLRLPDDHVLVILRNSPEWRSDQLASFGNNAFIAGKSPYLD